MTTLSNESQKQLIKMMILISHAKEELNNKYTAKLVKN